MFVLVAGLLCVSSAARWNLAKCGARNALPSGQLLSWTTRFPQKVFSTAHGEVATTGHLRTKGCFFFDIPSYGRANIPRM